MSLSVRTRFEVFKRDRFTCSYCGRTPPEVLLEADHIVPKAAGGSDDIANLTTACATCNRGKAARLLEEGTAPVVGRATVEELAERVEQAKAYMDLIATSGVLTERQIGIVMDAWAKAFGAGAEERSDGNYWVFAEGGAWPKESSLRRVLRSLPLDQIIHAVDIAAAKFDGRANSHATRYFFGVCWKAIREGSPIGERTQVGNPENIEQEAAAFKEGVQLGKAQENDRIRDLLFHYEDNGFATLSEALYALWPGEE